MEPFADLARRRTTGEMALLPRMLTGTDRRVHVRQTIREDHDTRIATLNEETEAKFNKLAGSVFSFFRGTALRFHRDMVGVNDYDEAAYAPLRGTSSAARRPSSSPRAP